jgi:hypothetical protein
VEFRRDPALVAERRATLKARPNRAANLAPVTAGAKLLVRIAARVTGGASRTLIYATGVVWRVSLET